MPLLKDTITAELQIALTTAPLSSAPSWTTVASNTTKKLRSAQVRRGRNSTLDQPQPGTMQVVLDNRDRGFDPLHASGAYYGNLKPGKRVRLHVTDGGESDWLLDEAGAPLLDETGALIFDEGVTTYTRFDGFIDGYPQSYGNPKDAFVTLRATDGMKRLAKTPLPSAWETAVLASAPKAWWRLGESSGTVAADSSGNDYHGTYEGGATFNSRAGLVFGDSDTAIEFPGVVAIPNVVSTGAIAFMPVGASVGAGTAAFTVSLWFATTDTTSVFNEYLYHQGPDVGLGGSVIAITYKPSDGDVIVTVGSKTLARTMPELHDGAPHHIAVVRTAGDVLNLYVDGVLEDTEAGAATSLDAAQPTHVGSLNRSDHNSVAITIDEVATYVSGFSAATVLALYQAGSAPHDGDTPKARIDRVLDAAGWPAALRDLDTGSAILGPANFDGTDALAHLQAVAESEGGRFFIARSGEVTLVGRAEQWTDGSVYEASQATFGDSGSELRYSDITLSYDDEKIRNDARISRGGGSVETSSDATSITDYGLYGYSGQSLDRRPAVVRDQADYIVYKHKTPEVIVTGLDLRPQRDPATMYPVLLGAELGYRYTVKRRPQGVGSVISQEVQLEGTDESFDSDGYKVSWFLDRAEPSFGGWGVGLWGSTFKWAY